MRTDYRHIVFDELPQFVRSMIIETVQTEGGYSNDKEDFETKYGIRRLSADSAGYYGPIAELTKDDAKRIWASGYYYAPGIDMLTEVSPLIGKTVFDTGGPAGYEMGIRHLQEALTSFNAIVNGQPIYGPDLLIDGKIGRKTCAMLKAYIDHRAKDQGARKLAALLNCLQAAHMVGVAVRNPAKRKYGYGWNNRVVADLVDLGNRTELV